MKLKINKKNIKIFTLFFTGAFILDMFWQIGIPVGIVGETYEKAVDLTRLFGGMASAIPQLFMCCFFFLIKKTPTLPTIILLLFSIAGNENNFKNGALDFLASVTFPLNVIFFSSFNYLLFKIYSAEPREV